MKTLCIAITCAWLLTSCELRRTTFLIEVRYANCGADTLRHVVKSLVRADEPEMLYLTEGCLVLDGKTVACSVARFKFLGVEPSKK
jgi:hypothetical protein